MILEMGGTLRQQHHRLVAGDDRHQHRRRPDRPHCRHCQHHRIDVVVAARGRDGRIIEPPRHLKIELGSIWYGPIAQRTGASREVTHLLLAHVR